MVLIIIMVHAVTPNQLQIGGMRFEIISDCAHMHLILIIVHRIGLWLAHDGPSENLFGFTQLELHQFLAT